MSENVIFALIAIIGAARFIHELAVYLKRRRQARRPMKIVMAQQCCCEQVKRDAPMTPAEHKIALHEQRG